MLNLFSVSISMSAVIILVLLFRKKLNIQYSSRVMCILWLVIAIRMLVPVQIELPLGQFQIDVNVDKSMIEMELPQMSSSESEQLPFTASPELNVEETMTSPYQISVSANDLIFFAWAAGAFFMLSKQIAAYLSISRWLKRNCIYLNTKDGFDVYVSSVLPEPLSFGCIKSSVYLTEQFKEDEWVLNHELAHCRHCDGLMMLIAALVKTIHWFNPLVYLMDKQWEADREMYCDESVLKDKTKTQRMEYMVTLYDAAESMIDRKLRFTSGLLDGEHQMVERFKQISNDALKRKGRSLSVVLSVLIIFCASLVGCTTNETKLLKEMMKKFDDSSLIKIVEAKVYDVGIDGIEYYAHNASIQLFRYDLDQLNRFPYIQSKLTDIEILLENKDVLSEDDLNNFELQKSCIMEEIERMLPVLNKKMEQNQQDIDQLLKKADFKKIESFEVVVDDTIEATIIIYLDEETELEMKFFKSGQMYITLGNGIHHQEKEIYQYNTEIIDELSELLDDYKYWKYSKEFWKNLSYSAPDWWIEYHGL